MEKITEKYYLGSNKNTLILYEKKANETFKKIGYYASLDGLYNSLIEKEVREDVEVINNIEKIISLVKELKEFTINHVPKQEEA